MTETHRLLGRRRLARHAPGIETTHHKQIKRERAPSDNERMLRGREMTVAYERGLAWHRTVQRRSTRNAT